MQREVKTHPIIVWLFYCFLVALVGCAATTQNGAVVVLSNSMTRTNMGRMVEVEGRENNKNEKTESRVLLRLLTVHEGRHSKEDVSQVHNGSYSKFDISYGDDNKSSIVVAWDRSRDVIVVEDETFERSQGLTFLLFISDAGLSVEQIEFDGSSSGVNAIAEIRELYSQDMPILQGLAEVGSVPSSRFE